MTASLLRLLLVLLAAPGLVHSETRPLRQAAGGGDTCILSSTAITCTCSPGQEELTKTEYYRKGANETIKLEVSGCSPGTHEIRPLQMLRRLSVAHTASLTFQERDWPLLRHLELVNVSHVVFQGPTFLGAGLETVTFDGIRVSTLGHGVLALPGDVQNVTFRDVHIDAVEYGAAEIRMGSNSQFSILRSKLLGVDQNGIAVRGVTNFTMHESTLATIEASGLQLYAAGPVSISDSQLESTRPILLTVKSGGSYRFVNNVWRDLSLLLADNNLLTTTFATVEVADNTFRCFCDPVIDAVLGLPRGATLLDSNMCDEGLCGRTVPLRVLVGCRGFNQIKAACREDLPTSPGTNSMATTMTTALLMAAPTAAALIL